MKTNIYEHLDYKKYVLNLIQNRPQKGRGERKQLAETLNCQMAFLTHVLSGDKDFSHEQALKISQYFCLNENEKEYFMDLLSYNRAGTKSLKEFYKSRLLEKKEKYNLLKNRLEENQNLSTTDQAEYYSHWLYAAVHMASTIPKFQSVEKISQHFNVNQADLFPIIEFLSSKGLLILENGKITPGKAHIYLSKDSPLINQHHMIWRAKAMHDLKTTKAIDLNYSLCFSVAEKDWPVIKEKMLEAINECLKVIRPSPEEKLGFLCVDLQEI